MKVIINFPYAHVYTTHIIARGYSKADCVPRILHYKAKVFYLILLPESTDSSDFLNHVMVDVYFLYNFAKWSITASIVLDLDFRVASEVLAKNHHQDQ